MRWAFTTPGREGTVASFIANGRRVAMVAFAPNVGSNSLNDPQIGLPLVADLAAKHDIVIVSFHGGAEGNGAEVLPFAREIFAGEDRGNVVEFAHAMIDAGADIVLGHGPHVVRPMELYQRPAHRLQPGQFRDLLRHQRRRHSRHRAHPAGDARRRRQVRLRAHRADDQIRPAGPSLDPASGVITLLHTLTSTAFPDGTFDRRRRHADARRSRRRDARARWLGRHDCGMLTIAAAAGFAWVYLASEAHLQSFARPPPFAQPFPRRRSIARGDHLVRTRGCRGLPWR